MYYALCRMYYVQRTSYLELHSHDVSLHHELHNQISRKILVVTKKLLHLLMYKFT